MKVSDLIQKLQDLPQGADVTIVVNDVVEEVQEVKLYGAPDMSGGNDTEFVVLT